MPIFSLFRRRPRQSRRLPEERAAGRSSESGRWRRERGSGAARGDDRSVDAASPRAAQRSARGGRDHGRAGSDRVFGRGSRELHKLAAGVARPACRAADLASTSRRWKPPRSRRPVAAAKGVRRRRRGAAGEGGGPRRRSSSPAWGRVAATPSALKLGELGHLHGSGRTRSTPGIRAAGRLAGRARLLLRIHRQRAATRSRARRRSSPPTDPEQRPAPHCERATSRPKVGAPSAFADLHDERAAPSALDAARCYVDQPQWSATSAASNR